MATPPSDDSRTMFKLLNERPGEWYPYEELRDAIAATVPPGRAIRKYQERLQSSRKIHQPVNPAPELSEDDQILYGAKACAQIAISSWVGRGVMRRQDVDGARYIKVKPGFRSYGINVNSSESQEAEPEVPKGPENAEGYTDPPPTDSEPFEAAAAPAEERTEQDAEEPPTRFMDAEPVRQFERTDEGDFRRVEEPVISRLEPSPWDKALPREQKPEIVTLSDIQECPECGLGVVDQARHEAWHEAQKPAFEQNAMALFDEVTMRTLLGDEIGRILDRFQLGMEQYLSDKFAELEELIQAQRRPSWQGSRWTDGVVRKRTE